MIAASLKRRIGWKTREEKLRPRGERIKSEGWSAGRDDGQLNDQRLLNMQETTLREENRGKKKKAVEKKYGRFRMPNGRDISETLLW